MAKITVGLPQGTRDFGPEVVRKRTYILTTIKTVFELYGFQPLETPAMENMETLLGKYGEEGDKLIFRVLDSGNPFSKEFFETLGYTLKLFQQFGDIFGEEIDDKEKLAKILSQKENHPLNYDPKYLEDVSKFITDHPEIRGTVLPKMKNDISGKALKYDLTIPFARYVAMNHAQLSFPFKRYQIQPVWRADRPQKGRYREFYQCDADVVGSNALLNEVELAAIYTQVFAQLGIPVEIKINSRKILAALADACGGPGKMTDITIAIDKLDKIGLEKVKEELEKKALNPEQITIIEQYLSISGSNEQKLVQLKELLGNNEQARSGIADLEYLLQTTDNGRQTTDDRRPTTDDGRPKTDHPLTSHVSRLTTGDSPLTIDFTLARGLNYYTGIIFEVKAGGVQMGSIGGGGRYDDLTGLFGVPGIPGVGISFGVDRIYDVMEELKLFPPDVHTGTQVLFFNLGEKESLAAFGLLQQLRARGIRGELYHESSKFDKQFKYAEKKNIPYIVIIGEKELADKTCNVKDLRKGEQQTISFTNLEEFLFI